MRRCHASVFPRRRRPSSQPWRKALTTRHSCGESRRRGEEKISRTTLEGVNATLPSLGQQQQVGFNVELEKPWYHGFVLMLEHALLVVWILNGFSGATFYFVYFCVPSFRAGHRASNPAALSKSRCTKCSGRFTVGSTPAFFKDLLLIAPPP